MSNLQFPVLYNGRPVEITAVGEEIFLVQISYKPLRIQRMISDEGNEYWIEVDSNRESLLSKEIGKLISGQLSTATNS